MSLTVAVKLDPLDAINIAGDSTFALMLAIPFGSFVLGGGILADPALRALAEQLAATTRRRRSCTARIWACGWRRPRT